jgi:ElaB/YqjD/DUF883 family membrane-anchored ribosome-binding protein
MRASKSHQPIETESVSNRAARRVREEVAAWRENACDTAAQIGDTTNAYVHKNPWTTLSMVALFAFSFGLLVGARRE